MDQLALDFSQEPEVRRPARSALAALAKRLTRYPPPGRLRVEEDASGRPVVIHRWERGAPYPAMRAEQLSKLIAEGGVPAVLHCLLAQRHEWLAAMERLTADKWIEETRQAALAEGHARNSAAIRDRVESAVEAAMPRIYRSR